MRTLADIKEQFKEGNKQVARHYEPNTVPGHVLIIVVGALGVFYSILRLFEVVRSGYGIVALSMVVFIGFCIVSQGLRNGQIRLKEKDDEAEELKLRVTELEHILAGNDHVTVTRTIHSESAPE